MNASLSTIRLAAVIAASSPNHTAITTSTLALSKAEVGRIQGTQQVLAGSPVIDNLSKTQDSFAEKLSSLDPSKFPELKIAKGEILSAGVLPNGHRFIVAFDSADPKQAYQTFIETAEGKGFVKEGELRFKSRGFGRNGAGSIDGYNITTAGKDGSGETTLTLDGQKQDIVDLAQQARLKKKSVEQKE